MELEQERTRWDEMVERRKKQENNERDGTAVHAVLGYMI